MMVENARLHVQKSVLLILLRFFSVPIDIDDSAGTLGGSGDNSSSPDNSDDFVLVPNNLPVDPCSVNYDKR